MDFSTIRVPRLQLALYMLSIRAPEPPFLPVETFIFPLSPQRVRKTFTGMSAVYDTAGPPSSAGVTRAIDSYGMSPFTYEIEGTTGWNLHQTDGFAATGQEAMQNIQDMLLTYAELNQIQRLNNDPNSYTLEFSDFFNGEFYQVEPIGPQEVRASDRAPLLQYYRFRLVGIAPIAAPLIDLAADAIDLLLGTPAASMLTATVALTSSILSIY
jgi:hypothetical protein